ncbi:MAG: rod shape-determining protein [Saprospiraceae bacterium]|nr:rod shape-determining protein [Saprospiraceae bacterium]MCF8251592.1 rod shape-determining protein [Saprospiraceae bacterium]MCF8282054.1 rod shape-determining protein [Bacteroidales bacterium]MCF8313487.1 rod shape-determining protein [Saprospiraceae bacterium]MCF8442228.1 rod shape-determining protein [Saprospiraceae bacterium]
MKLFSFFTQELAIDLGTANTLIMCDGKVVVDEPSIVAIDRRTGETIAVGTKAMQMHEKTHENIKTVRPLRDGVIADFQAAENMIEGLINMIGNRRRFFSHLKMVICIPSGITEVEKRAVFDSADHVDSKETHLIHEPMAAALGIGLEVEEPIGNVIIDIGGGTTEIAVIALSGIVCDQSIRTAGDEFTADIIDYMKRAHNILIGERTAEQIKINVGSALHELENPPPDYAVNGRDLMTGIPKQITISYHEVSQAIDKSIGKVEEAVMKALESTPPELAADIYKTGLYLTGGGALLRGLDKRLSAKTKLPVHITEDPLRAVVRGTGIALKNTDRFSFLIDRKSV